MWITDDVNKQPLQRSISRIGHNFDWTQLCAGWWGIADEDSVLAGSTKVADNQDYTGSGTF